jgi:putative membrane protein
LQAVLATALLVAYDLASDPNQVYRAVWSYPHGGIYYGVPVQNFIAWAASGFIGMVALQFILRRKIIFSDEEMLLPLPGIAYSAIVLHEAIFASLITKAPIAAAIGFVTAGALLISSIYRIRPA